MLSLDVRQLFESVAASAWCARQLRHAQLGNRHRRQRLLRDLRGHRSRRHAHPRTTPQAHLPARHQHLKGSGLLPGPVGGAEARRRARVAALSRQASHEARASASTWLGREAQGPRRLQVHGARSLVATAGRCPVPDLFFTYMSHRYPRLIDERRSDDLRQLDARDATASDDAPSRSTRGTAVARAQLGYDARRRGDGSLIRRRHPQDGATRGRRAAGSSAPRRSRGVARARSDNARTSMPRSGAASGGAWSPRSIACCSRERSVSATTRWSQSVTRRHCFASVARGRLSRMAQAPKA